MDFQLQSDNLLNDKECHALIKLSEKIGYSPSIIKGNFEGSYGYVVRNGMNKSRAAIENKPLANMLWNRIKKLIPDEIDGYIAVGLNERVRFYRYHTGQHFGTHTDGYFERENGERSFLTLMIYLNDDFTNGETLFLKREKVIVPKCGTALIFRHRQWHSGLAVKKGCKYILRTDVMYKKSEV